MLTTEVKQRINSCRDILVGKLPDPKSQVLQITNALIYKFMDDQDRIAEKLGGKASFFVKELKPYAWHKLFDSKLDNQQRADLYIEGVQKLSEAKHLPELFREIFKEAYVPFRAAGTITLFIDEINKFDYHHSEELGNAYEYLLSIMGSQGDAGQFRTPRHIIEFLVDMVDPHKGETIYDPAAGTAGFLISAYKHIVEANNGKLSATERNKLSKDISGVDISPDMAKMARVNLYLHGFATPNINEGDTLTDDDLWGQKYDVILANPPFMSPKGGIKPHDKFAIKAKRSEVLFVDYIAEHLKLKGRAGIIVPEGIIFQSGTAYKDLRKMLVDDGYLFAVVSLPAGVFQPYSGVKTSILVLDRERAKETEEVLFVKIENDGYSLSSQRTEVGGSQLPDAMEVVTAWRDGKKHETPIASWVTKKEIAESGDYNLTGERYRTFESKNSDWPTVKLGDVVEVLDRLRKPITKSDRVAGPFPYYGATGILDYVDNYIFDERLVLVGEDGAKWDAGDKTAFIAEGKYWVNNHAHVLRPDKNKILDVYLVSILNTLDLNRYITGVTVPKLNQEKLKSIEFPLPSIEVQQEIVVELDRYQKIIDGARQVVENYKPAFKTEIDWPQKSLGDLCDIKSGGTPSKSNKSYFEGGDVPWLKSEVCKDELVTDAKTFITKSGLENSSAKILKRNSTLIALVGATIGKTGFLTFEASTNQNVAGLYPKNENELDSMYLYFATQTLYPKFMRLGDGQFKMANLSFVKGLEIPVPPLSKQKEIVAVIKDELDSISGNKKLIEAFNRKIQDKIAEVWGE